MRKIRLDGAKVKRLRGERTERATQKEFAHEVQLSERKLRALENAGDAVSMDTANRIASALVVPVQTLFDEPPVPPIVVAPSLTTVVKLPKREILPRFDTAYAYAISDEASMFEFAKGNRTLISHVLTELTSETSSYAEELLTILHRLTWDGGSFDNPIVSLEEIAVRRRMRELLVLLKGNDVWVYCDTNIKTLPESFEIQPPDAKVTHEFQAIVAFGPPGEYGETSIKVPMDRGQPYEMVWS